MAEPAGDQSLFIIWSSADPEVAHNLAFMYAHNSLARGWWERVRLVIWGPSARLACEDESVADKLRTMMADGVEVWACRACADNYGVSERLEELGAKVVYVGQPVTDMLRQGWRQLTF
jgi:hypothetical protein